jgi:hypothetical protein
MPYTGTLSRGEDIPNINISDPTKYCTIIACTVTVQLPIRVLHGVCYSNTSAGDDRDDQSPNVVYILKLGFSVALANLLNTIGYIL